ncbi:MAG: 4-oxalocrotonate tautomerase [Pseudomonadota bacterium]
MPLTLTLTEGVLPEGSEQTAVARLTDVMLKWHGLIGNKVMTPNVTTMLNIQPRGTTFSGGQPFAGVWLEWKVPSFAFASREVQKGFFKDATDIIHELSGDKQPRENIYVNVVHTVDGAWNLDGEAMSNEELSRAIAQG